MWLIVSGGLDLYEGTERQNGAFLLAHCLTFSLSGVRINHLDQSFFSFQVNTQMNTW